IDARLDPADEAFAEQDRQHVPAPAPLGRRVKELPYEFEVEKSAKEGAVPDEWIERWEKCDRRRRLRRRSEQFELVAEDEAGAAYALDRDPDGFDLMHGLLAP